MMYSTTVQIFRMKYVILEATQKLQILTNVGGFKIHIFRSMNLWILDVPEYGVFRIVFFSQS
jgi:hypothetical protein